MKPEHQTISNKAFGCIAYEDVKINDEDYTNDNGQIICGKCGCPKNYFEPNTGIFVPVNCECKERAFKSKIEAETINEFRDNLVQKWGLIGLLDKSYLRYKFSMDDYTDGNNTDLCKAFVKDWDLFKKNGFGIVLSGCVGSGKTFYASCIANELIDRKVSVLITSFPRIINVLLDSKEKQKLVDKLNTPDLLIIDDFGIERSTDYALETIFSVIDNRDRANKPIIITTNLSSEEMKIKDNTRKHAIYSRILKRSAVVPINSRDRREELQKQPIEMLRSSYKNYKSKG